VDYWEEAVLVVAAAAATAAATMKQEAKTAAGKLDRRVGLQHSVEVWRTQL